ncbi:ribonuclease BN [Desulfonema ishimotonii]|uniref:Ribonuclease BN n=1 Tax=Desulfonema ishimotonii TaxID=45657 RepID=A0A401FZC5_9BACT|nr:YhjD/YihY/BrkB family envelope integrity protein [Desulfonema ishimotonii]GBC62310.1 ribonuclease BN [Desulfonema ishimotonii]
MQNIREKATEFMKTGLWRTRPETHILPVSLLIRGVRILLMAIRRFGENHCSLRASALTFFSILSIVPVAAMAFGIAQGFGFEQLLEKQLLENFPGQEEIITQVIGFANKLLSNTRSGILAGLGVGVLFWTVIKVLGHIEASLNAIWGIQKHRTMVRKITDYLSIMIIAPLLVIMSGSLNVFIRSQVTTITQKVALLEMFNVYILFALKLLPYGLIWVVFTLIYIVMPNTRVNFLPGLLAGVIGGTIYQLAQWAYINFQVGVANYNAIYGSFAALPLFLIWLQISWLIVLFGASVSASYQAADAYAADPGCDALSPALKRLVALQIARFLIRKFAQGEPPSTLREIADALEIPPRLTNQIIDELAEARIVSPIQMTEENSDPAWQPARDIHSLTIAHVTEALERTGCADFSLTQSEGLEALSQALEEIGAQVRKSPANRLLKDI